MFEITSQSAALVRFTPKTEAAEEGRTPCATLEMALRVTGDWLANLHPRLRDMLFEQPNAVDLKRFGMDDFVPEADTPVFPQIKRIDWQLQYTGAKVFIEYGIDEHSAIDLDLCEINRFRIHPQQDGTSIVSFRIDARPNDVQAGHLYALQSSEVMLSVTPAQAELPMGDAA